jgi:hypothetical protein
MTFRFRFSILAAGMTLGCPTNTSSNAFDTGPRGWTCDRVHDNDGLVMWDAVAFAALESPTGIGPNRSPDYAPNTGVAGPFDEDAMVYLAVEDGTSMLSEDGGCYWEEKGRLTAGGDWRLLVGGDVAYAVDMATGTWAVSRDLGGSWSPTPIGGVPAGLPVVDAQDPLRVRVVTDTGVMTTTDGGATWSMTAGLPPGVVSLAAATAHSANLDTLMLTADNQLYQSSDGGMGWAPTGLDLDAHEALGTVAIHPDDPAIRYVVLVGADGGALAKSTDGGASWETLLEPRQIDIAAGSLVVPLPGEPAVVLTTYGDDEKIYLSVTRAGTGIKTYSFGSYTVLSQLALGPEWWLGAVYPGE